MAGTPQLGPDPRAGTARVPVVALAALATFFFVSLLEYSLPLYFDTLSGFPKNMWAELAAWQAAPWCFGPILAGVLAHRIGERRVWAAALAGQAIVPLLLAVVPDPWFVPRIAFWSGLMNGLMWVSGFSLAQIAPPERRGLSNGLIMMSLGVGSLLGPLTGRAILWYDELTAIGRRGGLRDVGLFLIDAIKTPNDPSPGGFSVILWGLVVVMLLTAGLIFAWVQRPGRLIHEPEHHTARQTFGDLRLLLADPRFWGLVVALGLLGGPLFQASNQYLTYRARDLGLIVGSQDKGWILLQLVQRTVCIPAGLAVGLIAGRRAAGIFAVAILAVFAISSGAIGLADSQLGLFGAVCAFEFARQFMRWANAGYLSEHMPQELRATAIGVAVTMSGIGTAAFGFLAKDAMNPNSNGFNSSEPFFVAATIGLIGACGLFLLDRAVPIRVAGRSRRASGEPSVEEPLA